VTYDASNRKDIRAAEKASAELDRSHLEVMTLLMSHAAGRSWFYHRLASCQCFVDVPTFEPYHDYFSAGRRSVGLQDMAALQTHCPDQYILMIREENVRLAALAQRLSRPDYRRDLAGREPSDPDSPDGDPDE
jgi:hypothetical protein